MAAEQMLDAAKDYLDIDILGEAQKLLSEAENITGISSEQRAMIESVSSIIKLRSDIRGNKLDFKDDPGIIEKKITGLPVFGTTGGLRDTSFLNRQMFKIFTDVGEKMTEFNPGYTAPVFEVKALNYLEREKTLNSYRDIKRLNHLERTFKVNLEDRNIIDISPGTDLMLRERDMKELRLNAGEGSTVVGISNDLFLVGKLYETISSGNSKENVNEMKRIKVQRGHVTIPVSVMEEHPSTDEQRIKKINGVKRVTAIPDKR
jgi:hypothetical protein